jgi:hypothetical protein
MKQTSLKSFFALSTLEGIIALCCLFLIPSKETNVWLLGYSKNRIAIGLAVLIFILIFLFFSLKTFFDRKWVDRFLLKVNGWITSKDNLLILTVTVLYLIFFELALLILFLSPAAQHMLNLSAIFTRSISIFFWIVLLTLQLFFLLRYSFNSEYCKADFYNRSKILKTLLILIIISTTAFHWVILVSQASLFTAIPYWYWQFTEKPFNPWELLFFVIVAVSILGVCYILKHPYNKTRNIILLLFLAYAIQIGFGFMDGQGYESMRLKFMNTGHKQYVLHAVDKPVLYEALAGYDKYYGESYILGTKPPGGLFLTILMQKVADWIDPQSTYEGRATSLSRLMTYVFPILSVLVLIPLYHLSKAFLDEEDAFLPGILYIFCPNVILIIMHMDQFLYPFFFVSGLLLTMAAARKQSFGLGFLMGIFYYTMVYFSFSLIPMIALSVLWVAIDYWLKRKQRSFWGAIRVLAGIGLGILVAYGLFYFFLNYDFLTRYQNAFALHRRVKEFKPGMGQILAAIPINNLELAFWTGIPIAWLAITRAIKTSKAVLNNKISQLDWLMIAFLLLYGALNILGQTRTEVGRLWLFLVPLIIIFASVEAKSLFRRREIGIFFVIGLQLITTLCTYQFQDFY